MDALLHGYGQEYAGVAGNAESGRRPTANAQSSHIKHPASLKIFWEIFLIELLV